MKTNLTRPNDMGEIIRGLNELKESVETYGLLAAKTMLTIKDVALITGLSPSQIYRLTSAREIPYYKPSGKIIYFDKNDVVTWMRGGRISSTDEIEAKADDYIIRTGKRA